MTTIERFIKKQRELLKLEQDEEVEERHQIYESKSVKELVERGICVNRLQLDHQRTGLFGKNVVVFNFNSNENISSHQLSSGMYIAFTVLFSLSLFNADTHMFFFLFSNT